MKMTYVILIILLLAIAGCGKSKLSSDEKPIIFDKPVTLKLDSVKVAPVLLEEQRIVVSGNYLMTVGIRRDTLFRVFRLDDLKYMGAFGMLGKGPMDFNFPSLSGFRADGSDFTITDRECVRKFKLELTTDQKVKPVVINRFRRPEGFSDFEYAMVINDSLIAGSWILRSEKELAWFNPVKGTKGFLYEYPKLMENVPAGAYGHLFTKGIDISPDKKTIAFAYNWFPCIRIINPTINKSTLLRIDTGFEQNQKPTFTPQTVNITELTGFYERICVSDNYIVAFMLIHKLSEGKDNQFDDKQLREPELQIITTSGKPIARMILKNWMKVFTIDEAHNRILFLNPLVDNYIYFCKIK
jgi:hypothetical protein